MNASEKSLKKPACLSNWNSSNIFNKYANIGTNEQPASIISLDSQRANNENMLRMGTASILTNSSVSATSLDLPLQTLNHTQSSTSAASKAIIALQDKVRVLEKENTFLREIVATNEQAKREGELTEQEIQELQEKHSSELQLLTGIIILSLPCLNSLNNSC
jgi:hypothetical protein